MKLVQLVLGSGASREVLVRQKESLLHVLFAQGLTTGKALCAGVGLCGQCRVRFFGTAPVPTTEEFSRLGEMLVAQGWRLACKHQVQESCCLELPDFSQPTSENLQPGEMLAVDIGTTRIKWAVGAQGAWGPEQSAINPQMGAGSEVMARLRYAMADPAAASQLRSVVLDFIRSLALRTGARRLAVAGNTTMLALLLGAPLSGLATAPYVAPFSGDTMSRLADNLPLAYVPPVLGPFIGADISAGLAYLCSLPDIVFPFLLADLGTNGEFVLAVDERTFIAASVPLGPAIEGVGLCCGSVSGPGVASIFTLTPAGLSWEAKPLNAISGTGYLSLLAILRQVGLLDSLGHFSTPTMPLGRKLQSSLTRNALGQIFALSTEVFLAARDVEEILKVKAGINSAVQVLFAMADLPLAAVRKVYLAGALGQYADLNSFLSLGILPQIFADKIEVVGNTSLAGICKILENPEMRFGLSQLSRQTQLVDLVADPDFSAIFVRSMCFHWI